MERRNFLIGLGAATGGGAAMLGTGAFSRIESQRSVTIQVAEDPYAYLGLDECDSVHGDNYVELDSKGHLIVAIGENPNDGHGVNSDSTTWFHDVFQVCNQGKEDTCLWIVRDEDWPTVEAEDFAGAPRVDFYLGDDDEQSILGADNATHLELGQCTCIGIKTRTHGLDATVNGKTLLEELDDEIVIVADVSKATVSENGLVDLNGNESSLSNGNGAGLFQSQSEDRFVDITDLTDSDLDTIDLADTLVDIGIEEEVEIDDDSVAFTGDERAGGYFEDSPDIIGFENGVVLSSGQVTDVEGPNESPSTSTAFGTPGDADLEALLDQGDTHDAAVLEFEFDVPDDAEDIAFNYVFGSEEYNEYVGSDFNDVFGFFLNGENIATVPDPDNSGDEIPAAINNINHGYSGFDSVNPELFINNDPYHGDGVEEDPEDPPGPGVGFDPSTDDAPYNTEMDGFTTVLEAGGSVDPQENPQHLKLAIADVNDAAWDSWVLLEADSLGTGDSTPDFDPC